MPEADKATPIFSQLSGLARLRSDSDLLIGKECALPFKNLQKLHFFQNRLLFQRPRFCVI